MKIAVLGAGAMGSIYGGHLSTNNDVYMIDKKAELVDKINADGLKLFENDTDVIYHPAALLSSEGIGEVDLVIIFVKALYSRAALMENKGIIGDNTYVMTLQNGAGHEDIILEFVPNEDSQHMLDKVKVCLDSCGFDTHIYDNIQQLIWDKLFTNVSLSVLTGVLQVPIGFIATDEYAWNMTVILIKEAMQVAKAMGLEFNEEEMIERVRNTSINSPEGRTSIYADLKAGRLTEVNTISGAVVKAGDRLGVPVPSHKMIVNMVHAMENKSKNNVE